MRLRNSWKNSMRIYPNPANNEFVVYSQEGLSHLRVYSLIGQLIQDMPDSDLSQVALDCSAWASGCYIVEGTVKGQPVRIKIIKQ